MRAAILAVGSELLGSDRLDTDSLLLTEALERHGVELRRKEVVGDDRGAIAEAVSRLVAGHDLVLVTGGLGPTTDDVTREGAAEALGRRLALDERVLAGIEERYRAFGREMPAVNRRQAMVPDGDAEVIANARGSAPGLRLGTGSSTLFLFPGVPAELEGMIASRLVPWLEERSAGWRRERVTLKVASLTESEVEERIAPAYGEMGAEAISVLAGREGVLVRAYAAGPEPERRKRLAAMEERLAELLGDAVYTRREEETLEAVVGRLLGERGETLVTAESCTGGLVAARITRVAGSSAYFLGGAVTYDDRLKRELLGVPVELLERHGAVSEEVARAMASGARSALGADWAVAITGIAGPAGGTEDKPVGTVHFAWAGPDAEVTHRCRRFLGSRDRVRHLAGQVALEVLRRRLAG